MFVLTILEKNKETRLKFSQGSVTVLSKIANYQEVRVKLTNTQLNKLKSTAKRQANKIRNAFANNLSADTKLKYLHSI